MPSTEDESRINILNDIVRETLWMARRYAHTRKTFAAYSVNKAIDQWESLGGSIPLDQTIGGKYAEDGGLGRWLPEQQRFERG